MTPLNYSKWEEKKMQQSIWPSILEYARIDQDIACKDVEISTMYTDPIGKYDKWGKKELFYHGDNTKTMHWNIRVPNVSFVRHAQVVHSQEKEKIIQVLKPIPDNLANLR